MTQSSVRHNEKDERFETDAAGGTAFVEYIIDGDEITFTHTEVPKQAEGKGVAGRIVAEARCTRAARTCA
jgi:predicted GNAT family acetyltransferase